MPRILPIIFGLVGLGLLIAGGIATQHTRNLLAVAEEVPGVVVDYTTSTSDGSSTYSPVYEYEFEGRTYRHERSVSSSGRPTMGDTTTMLIDPEDPSTAKSNTFLDKWFLTTLLGGMGALFSVLAIIFTVVILTSGRSGSFAASSASWDTGAGGDEDETEEAPAAPPSTSSTSGNSGPFL